MQIHSNFKRVLLLGVIFLSITLISACGGGGSSGSGDSNASERSVFTGTYRLKDYSVQFGGQTFMASQVFESQSADCIIHEDGFMEMTGCFKITGEPEFCGADSGMIDGNTLTITTSADQGCTYSGTVQQGAGNMSWEFPPSCGNEGDGPSIWHWTKVSETTAKSLMSPNDESINMISDSIKMIE